MASLDELEKPLGQKQTNRKPSRFSPLLTVAFLAAIALAAGSGYYASNLAGTDIASTNDETLKVEQSIAGNLMRESINTDPVKVGAITNDELQPNELKELAPSGEIKVPTIVPRKPVAEVRQKQILAHLPDSQLVEKGATGVIPKKSGDGLRPMDVYSRQAATEGNFGVARVVIVVGGMGISQTSTQRAIQSLPGDVTLAFAPYGNSLLRWMQAARKGGHELLLQVPMEPFGYPQNNPGVHTLTADAGVDENLANLHWAMSRITNYVGVMNYQGGKLITDPEALKPVFDDLSERGLLFLEDGSVQNSMGKLAAGKSLLPYAKAHIQIDSVRTRAAIGEKLNKLADQARRTGLAIGVANAFPETIAMISEFAKQAKKLKLELTPVSAIVTDPLKPR